MIKLERKLLITIALVGIGVWFADAAVDSFLFGHGDFLDSAFLKVSLHETYFRWFYIIVYTIFSVSLIKIMAKHQTAQGELNRHLTAIETSMDGVAIFNADHEYLYTNEAYAAITGFKSPLALIGRSFKVIYDDEQLSWLEHHVFPALDKEGKWHGELYAHRKDGTLFTQEVSITRLPDRGCVCVMRDITQRKEREEALERSERFMRTIFDSIRDPFCIIDRNYRIIRANDAYAALKSRTVDDLLDRTCFEVLAKRNTVCDGCVIEKTFSSGDPCAKEKKVSLKNGETLWLEIYTYPIQNFEGDVQYVIEYTRDITDRKKFEDDRKRLIERLEYLSKVDGLTGLLNRRALTDQLTYEIDRVRRYAAELSIILCDMDNLKEINDTHGHIAGDLAIQLVSATLRNTLRNTDIAGRYGGDEFLVIVPETGIEGARNIAEKIRAAAQAIELRLENDKQVAVTVSMGIASLTATDDMDTFVTRVDVALYASKHEGKNRITVALPPGSAGGQ